MDGADPELWKMCQKHKKEREAMKPPMPKFEQEEILVDEFVNGIITAIEYDENHEFKGQFAKVGPAVRLTFTLDGYEQPKKSRWFAFSYHEKAKLYQLIIKPLVPNAKPYMDFDMENLKGVKCKLMFSRTESEGKVFFNLDMVKPVGLKPPAKAQQEQLAEEEAPF